MRFFFLWRVGLEWWLQYLKWSKLVLYSLCQEGGGNTGGEIGWSLFNMCTVYSERCPLLTIYRSCAKSRVRKKLIPSFSRFQLSYRSFLVQDSKLVVCSVCHKQYCLKILTQSGVFLKSHRCSTTLWTFGKFPNICFTICLLLYLPEPQHSLMIAFGGGNDAPVQNKSSF